MTFLLLDIVHSNPIFLTDAEAKAYAAAHPYNKGFRYKITPANTINDQIDAAFANAQNNGGFTVEREN